MGLLKFPDRGTGAGNATLPPDNDNMDARVTKLEGIAEKTGERLAAIEKDLAVMASNYATKSDVSEAKSSIVMWIVGTIIAVVALPQLPAIVQGVKAALGK